MVGGDAVLWSGCSVHLWKEGPSNCPAWHSEELLGIVQLILENINQYLWGFGMENIQECEGAQLFGDGTGVWEGPAPPSKAFIEHFSRAQSKSGSSTNSK